LQGGIEKYLQEFPEGGYWQGKNFVFDKREAIGVGCTEGVGGIVQSNQEKKAAKVAETSKKGDKKKNKGGEDDDEDEDEAGEKKEAVAEKKEEKKEVKVEILGRCCVCELPWDR